MSIIGLTILPAFALIFEVSNPPFTAMLLCHASFVRNVLKGLEETY